LWNERLENLLARAGKRQQAKDQHTRGSKRRSRPRSGFVSRPAGELSISSVCRRISGTGLAGRDLRFTGLMAHRNIGQLSQDFEAITPAGRRKTGREERQ